MSVYLLTGDPFLVSEALDRIRSEEATDAMSEVHLDASASPVTYVETFGTSTLFGGKRLVVLTGAESLKKDQVQALETYLEDPSPDVVLVLVAGGRTKLDAIVKRAGTVIGLDPPKGRRLAAWIRERAVAHGIKADDRAAWTLIDSVGSDLRDLDAALEQLGTAFGASARIGEREVRSVFQRNAEERTYVLTDAVGDRRLDAAMTSLRRLLVQGEEPLVIFGALTAHVRRMLRARPHVDAGARAVGEALGMPDWRAERLTKQARTYKEDELRAAMQLLAQVDVEMKGEFPSPEVALERAVRGIVTGTRHPAA